MDNTFERMDKKLGFGMMRLPKLDPDDAASIDLEQVKQMVDLFLDRGFCYFDTAYPYHQETSEIALRKSLVERYPRESVLSTSIQGMCLRTLRRCMK